MTKPRKAWTEYPEAYAALAKSVATASLPARYGPKPLAEALQFRQAFYRFREALRRSVPTRDGSYPARLYEMLEPLSVFMVPASDCANLHYIVFDLDPIVQEMDRIDPAAAQIREIARANFAAVQIPLTLAKPVSEPIFSPDELSNRINEIKGT